MFSFATPRLVGWLNPLRSTTKVCDTMSLSHGTIDPWVRKCHRETTSDYLSSRGPGTRNHQLQTPDLPCDGFLLLGPLVGEVSSYFRYAAFSFIILRDSLERVGDDQGSFSVG